MTKERKIAKVVTRVLRGERQSDLRYWLSQTPEARIAALEEIRAEYHQWRYGAQSRLKEFIESLNANDVNRQTRE